MCMLYFPLVSSQWLSDRLVPTNGSDHGVETDLEQLHGAGLPVSISRHSGISGVHMERPTKIYI